MKEGKKGMKLNEMKRKENGWRGEGMKEIEKRKVDETDRHKEERE